MTTLRQVVDALIEECRDRLVRESLPRIRKSLEPLTDEEIWRRPNANTVSPGNLVIHLCGNVRQWIISGLGGAEDQRDRSREFSEEGPIPRAELLDRLERTLQEAMGVIEKTDAEALLEKRIVQGFSSTRLSILIHVVEHFSYHTGQIAYAVKSRKDVDLGFYAGI